MLYILRIRQSPPKWILEVSETQTFFWYSQDFVTGPSPSINSCIGPLNDYLNGIQLKMRPRLWNMGSQLSKWGHLQWITLLMRVSLPWCNVSFYWLIDSAPCSFIRRGSCRPVLNHIKDHQMGDRCGAAVMMTHYIISQWYIACLYLAGPTAPFLPQVLPTPHTTTTEPPYQDLSVPVLWQKILGPSVVLGSTILNSTTVRYSAWFCSLIHW